MPVKPFSQPPSVLVVLAVFILFGVILSREASTTEALPAFLPLERNFSYIELAGEDGLSGIIQFNDDLPLISVIKMAAPSLVGEFTGDPGSFRTFQSGELLEVTKKDRKISLLRRGWMPASHRVALALPLHPDRMSCVDWTFLPGVGDVLAERIENNRHKNGEFKTLKNLRRVKGIGNKRIEAWKGLFEEM